MKIYLKQTLLLLAYHPIAYFSGMLISGIVGVILGFFIKIGFITTSRYYDPVVMTIAPLIVLFLLVFRDGCISNAFSPRFIALCAVPTFIIQHLCILHNIDGMVTTGSCAALTYALFPNQNGFSQPEYYMVMLGIQLLLHLPTILLAYYCGFRCKSKKS